MIELKWETEKSTITVINKTPLPVIITSRQKINKNTEDAWDGGTRWCSKKTLSSPPLTNTPKSQLFAEQPSMEKDQNLPVDSVESTNL